MTKLFSVYFGWMFLFLTILSCSSKPKLDLARALPSEIPAMAKPKLLVYGNRGARARFPENSIVAFQEALEVGADAIAMDLNVTKDNVVVVTHDAHINQTLCRKGGGPRDNLPGARVRDLTLAEIKGYDCGSFRNRNFPRQEVTPGTQIPTLAEVFRFLENSPLPEAKTIQLSLQLKTEEALSRSGKAQSLNLSLPDFVRLVLNEVREHGLLNRIVIDSTDFELLKEARNQEPAIRISARVEKTKKIVNLAALALDLHATMISPEDSLLTDQNLAEIHAAHALVIPWTVNSTYEWARLIHLGVDGIITDDPRDLINFLK